MSAFENAKDYKIIYSANEEYGIYFAKILKDFFSLNGICIEASDDTAEETALEILLGDTNRYKTALSSKEYAVRLLDGKLLFEGGHRVMVEKAIKTFIAAGKIEGDVFLSGKDESFEQEVTLADGRTYKYVWGDEFDGNHIDDITRFSTKDNGYRSQIEGRYSEYSFSDNTKYGCVKDGCAVFHAEIDENSDIINGRAFCTGDKMWWQYGYAEISAKLPFKHGAWPAWWTTNVCHMESMPKPLPFKDWKYAVEVDMFESWGKPGPNSSAVTANIHKWYDHWAFRVPGYENDFEGRVLPINENGNPVNHADKMVVGYVTEDKVPDGKFHKFGFLWTPEKLEMLIDDKPYITYDISDDNCMDGWSDMSMFRDTPMEMIFDSWIICEGNFCNAGPTSYAVPEDSPIEFLIEYVRLYQTEGEGKLWNLGLDRLKEKGI